MQHVLLRRAGMIRKGLEEVNEKTIAKDQLRNVIFRSILDDLQWGRQHVCINSQ